MGVYIDTPIAGGAFGAAARTLSFMVGHPAPTGTTEADEIGNRVMEILSLIGLLEKVQFCGKPGMCQVAKIAHNYVVADCTLLQPGRYRGNGGMTDGCANSFQMHLEQALTVTTNIDG